MPDPTSSSPTTESQGEELVRRDRRGLLRNVSLSVVGQITAFGAGLLTMIATTRLLGPAGYGRLAIFFMFHEFVSYLIGWPNIGLMRFGREEMGRVGRLAATFWARIGLLIPCLGGMAIVLFLLRGWIDRYLPLAVPSFALLLCFAALNELIAVVNTVLQSVGKFGTSAVLSFGVRAFNLILIVTAFVLVGIKADVTRVLFAQTASLIIVLPVALALLPRKTIFPIGRDDGAARKIAGYSWSVILIGFCTFVINWVDIPIIKHFRTPDEVGLFAVAYQAVTVLLTLQLAFVSGFLPFIMSVAVERKHDALRTYLDELVPQAAWLVGGGCLVIAMCAEAIPIVMGSAYVDSVPACQILMAGVGFSTIAALQGALAKAMDRIPATFVVSGVLAGLKILYDFALVPRFGIVGAATATTAAFALSGMLYFPIMNGIREVRGEHPRMRYRALVGMIPAFIFAGIAATPTSPATRLAYGGALLVIWLFAAKTSGVFKKSTLELAREVHMPGWFESGLRKFYAVAGK